MEKRQLCYLLSAVICTLTNTLCANQHPEIQMKRKWRSPEHVRKGILLKQITINILVLAYSCVVGPLSIFMVKRVCFITQNSSALKSLVTLPPSQIKTKILHYYNKISSCLELSVTVTWEYTQSCVRWRQGTGDVWAVCSYLIWWLLWWQVRHASHMTTSIIMPCTV